MRQRADKIQEMLLRATPSSDIEKKLKGELATTKLLEELSASFSPENGDILDTWTAEQRQLFSDIAHVFEGNLRQTEFIDKYRAMKDVHELLKASMTSQELATKAANRNAKRGYARKLSSFYGKAYLSPLNGNNKVMAVVGSRSLTPDEAAEVQKWTA